MKALQRTPFVRTSISCYKESALFSQNRSFATKKDKEAIPSDIIAEKLENGQLKFTFTKTAEMHKCEGPNNYCLTTKEELLQFYQMMQRIRRTETEADKLYKSKHIKGFLHLYSGQEAVCVGMEGVLTHQDHIITAYRDHGHLIGRGGTPKDVLSELLAKATGCSKGKGGSMHMYRRQSNFYGGNGIVGAQVPVGAGIAFSQKYLKSGKVAVALYGDGAANQGQIFEAFNMAQLWKLPCIFVCENNKYAMGTSMERGSASFDYYKRGDFIPGIKVDGMDILAVKEASRYAVDFVLNTGPILLEMETYRYSGHSMSDPGTTYRTRDEITLVRQTRDPIEKVKLRILHNEIATPEEIKAIDDAVKNEVNEAVKFALDSSLPELQALYEDIYVEPMPIRGVELSESSRPN